MIENEIHYTWVMDRENEYIKLVLIMVVLSLINVYLVIIGIIIYLIEVYWGRNSSFNIKVLNSSIEIWYGNQKRKKKCQLPYRLFQNPILEDWGKIFILNFNEVKDIDSDPSYSVLFFKTLEATIKVEIKGKNGFLTKEQYDDIKARWSASRADLKS